MNYDEFIEAIEELGISVEEVAEELDTTVDDVLAWKELDALPPEALEFIKEATGEEDAETKDQ